MTIDEIVARIHRHLDLEAETEYEVLEEIRAHLEDAVAAARVRGADDREALVQAAARFGVQDIGPELQSAHAGKGTADGLLAAALPVTCALVLRWVVFAPDGTAVGWLELLARPVFWVIALVALLVPLLKFSRRRYALVAWAFFWMLSIISVAWPALHW